MALELDDREAECCGHRFQTRRQRVVHEQKVERGERVLCPCGDVCSDGREGDRGK
jgi:hypothetical protein